MSQKATTSVKRKLGMKVLVTGGTGFLGGYLLRRLLAGGGIVRFLARPPERNARKFAITDGEFAGTEKVTGDLHNAASLKRAVEGMEVICHCAAHVRARGSWDEFEEVTIRGTERLLEAACLEGVKRFVHVSSLGVYGLSGNETITEDSPFDDGKASRGHYTRSKIESERLVWKYSREHGLPVTVIRPGILYGPGRPPFVARLCVPIGPKLRIAIGRPQQLLPLAFVENVVDAIQLALQSDRAIGRAYNVVDDGIYQGEYLTLLKRADLTKALTILVSPTPFYRVISMVDRLCRSIKFPAPISRHQLERAFASLHYDTSRARQELGWSPKVGVLEALRKIREAQTA